MVTRIARGCAFVSSISNIYLESATSSRGELFNLSLTALRIPNIGVAPGSGEVPVPPFEGLTQDRPVPKHVKPDELWFVGNFMAWFVHEDDARVRLTAWADLWKAAVYFADGQKWPTRAGPAPDMAWRWIVEVAAFAADEGNVRLPSQILACVLYWDLCDASSVRAGRTPTLRPPVATARIKATLAAISLRCLLLLPAGEGMLYQHGSVWTASDMAVFAARAVDRLGAKHRLLTRELAALARDTLAGHAGHAKWRSASS
jgi:hypothetical protein